MPTKSFWREVARHLNPEWREDQSLADLKPVTGGDISQSFHLSLNEKDYFVKVNRADRLAIFESERDALNTFPICCPSPIACGVSEGHAYLALNFMPLCTTGDEHDLARTLAKLHNTTDHEQRGFGWHEDNFIGSTPQPNRWHNNWLDFWWQQRMLPQLELAYTNGFKTTLKPLARSLKSSCKRLLEAHTPVSVLVHGDLWSGNKAFLADGKAVLFDPAAYYGDKETDIAMTRLFGGFSSAFYREYSRIHPESTGFEERQKLYQLYHLLNHLNLFGSGYLKSVTSMILELENV